MGLVLSFPVLATVIALVIARCTLHLVSEVPRGILSSVGFCTLAVVGRQVAYLFLCDCDRIQCVLISTREWNVPYPHFRQSFSKFYNYYSICIIKIAKIQILVRECSIAIVRARSKEEAICRRGPHNIVAQEGNYRR
ncbi:hypothetical protein V1477_019654 [Vespula maculifrons]|uniref:Secreted protein n=1 Tax=Vespula maculifrons TaxID=7453 RepID=A0ABD2AR16_VESMC